MKTILQINLESSFNKNYYRIKRNRLEITKDNPATEYEFDNICYSSEDVNSSIIYDIILDFSDKNKFLQSTKSSQSINLTDSSNGDTKKQGPCPYISSTFIQESLKQPQFKYTVLFDQILDNQSIQQFIREISNTQIFRKQKIKIGHFLGHQNGIYDFHQSKENLTETQREELQKQYGKLHGSIEDNFMWIYNKQINLCEQVKLANIPHLMKNISYISAQQFSKLNQPSLGIQLASNLTKAEQIKHKELQNKKILEFFVINIGTKIRIMLVLFNYNKSYSFTVEEQKQITQLLMMYGVVTGEIKYQTIKVQILNKFMKNNEKLYYVMYFPGPRINGFTLQMNSNSLKSSGIRPSSNIFNSTCTNYISNSIYGDFNRMKNSASSVASQFQQMMRQKRQTCYNMTSSKIENLNNSQTFMNTSKISQISRTNNNSPQKLNKLNQLINCTFHNYKTLKTKDKDNLQKIIKQYLIKKQNNLKMQLEKVKERVKELKLSQRIEQYEVSELKNKCTKALEKMSQSIIDLQRMGIHNVERHMDWLKLIVDQKKQMIKQQQQEIQDINKKIIQNRKSHEYFYRKMMQFKDKLKQKYNILARQREKRSSNHSKAESIISMQDKQKGKKDENKQNENIQIRSQLTDLSLNQLQQLQQHKQKLKAKLVVKLKNSAEKKNFFDTLAEIKNKVSKLELTRLQQKYFDLLHD